MKCQEHDSAQILSVCALALAVSALVAPTSAAQNVAQPPITWSTAQIRVTLAPGEGTSSELTFVSAQNLSAVVMQTVPQIASLLSVEPSSFSSVPANTPQSVRVSFLIPSTQALGTYEGTIRVTTSSRTIPSTLKVTVNVWPSATGNGVAVHYPPTYEMNPRTFALGGPLSLNTFHSSYLEGGVIPSGGAEVDFTRIPLPPQPLSDVIAKDLEGATIESADAIIISGASGNRIAYTDVFTQSLVYKNVAVYVPHGAFLYKFFLTYQAGNPLESQLLAAFQQMLTTVLLVE